jgi:hypothetical protein
MREIRQSGSEGGGTTNRLSLPLLRGVELTVGFSFFVQSSTHSSYLTRLRNLQFPILDRSSLRLQIRR